MAAQEPNVNNQEPKGPQTQNPPVVEGPTDVPVQPQVPSTPVPESPPAQQGPAPQTENQDQGSPPPAPTPPPPKKKFPIPKKTLLLVLGGVFLLTILFFVVRALSSGLGGGGDETITWWGLWEDESIVAPLIQEFESQNPDVKIEYVKQSHKDYRERLTNALARGEGPDIFRFHNTWVPMFRQDLDSVPASVMSPAEFVETFYPVASKDLSSGSGIAGIPLEYDGITLFINEDLFANSGKTPPETWDDLRQIAIELTTKDEQGVITQAGVALGRTENVDHWEEILALMMIQNGASLANPTGKLAEDALVFFTVFSNTDGVWDATLPPSTTAFAAGKLAMYFAPSWRAFEISQQNPDLNFRTVPLPQLPKEGGFEQDISYATYWAEGVWARSANKESAWDFLRFLSTKESLQKLYQSASRTRAFGEPYPRVDMAESLVQHPVLGSIVSFAPDAESWYLASETFDGPTGLNSQLSAYFQDAVNGINEGDSVDKTLVTMAEGVRQVLVQYGIR